VLSDDVDLTCDYKHGSYIYIVDGLGTGSSFWDTVNEDIKKSGYKTDVFLRTLGTLPHSDIPALKAYEEETAASKLPKFAVQLITLLEDLRLEEIIKKKRPGTIRDFQIRKQYLKHYFESQLAATSLSRNYALGELFCLIYLTLQADDPDPSFPRADGQQLMQLDRLNRLLYEIFEATTTAASTRIAENIVYRLEADYTDRLHDYFSFPIAHIGTFEKNTLFDELTRTDELANEDMEDVDDENNEYIDEQFSTWHRENENSDRKQTFLQFELDVGTKTNKIGRASCREMA